ncbi:MAG: hypothetical protein Q9224_001359, partial [Gallowayella concinna]
SDDRDVDSPGEHFDTIRPSSQTDSHPQGQTQPGPMNQEDISVEDFLKSDVSYAVPWTTARKSQLLPREEEAAGLDRAPLKRHHGKLINEGVNDLMDGVIRATRRAHERKIQEEIEAEWVPRCKAWLRQQRAQLKEEVAAEHRVQNRQHWLDTEGAKFRDDFLRLLDKVYIQQKAKWEAAFEQEWNDGARYKYHMYLRSGLKDVVKQELRKELRPVILEELRAKNLPSTRLDAQRDNVGDIRHYQQISHFAQDTGSNIRAREASERLNSAVDSGLPNGPENRPGTGTSAYNKGLFNMFPLDAPSYGPLIHHPQPIQSASTSNVHGVPSRAVRNHGIVGEPIIPRRVHALQKESIATQSSVASRYHPSQPLPVVPALSTGHPPSMLAAETGRMLPPPRPAGSGAVSQLQPSHIHPMMAEALRPVSSMEKNKTPAGPTLLDAHKASMVLQDAHEEADRDRSRRVNVETGERRDPPVESSVSNEAKKDGIGRSGHAELGPNTANLDARNAFMASQHTREQVHSYPSEIDSGHIENGRHSLSKSQASEATNVSGNGEPVRVKLSVRAVDFDETQSLAQQQGQDKQVQEETERDRTKIDGVHIGNGRDPLVELEASNEENEDGSGESAPADLGAQPIACDKPHGQTQQQCQDKQMQAKHADKARDGTGRDQIREHQDSPIQPQASNEENKDGSGELEPLASGLRTIDSLNNPGEVQQPGQEAQMGTLVPQTVSVPSQKQGKKRARPADDGTEEVDIRREKNDSRNEAPKREAKRPRHDPPQQNEGPSTRTRAAARKAAVVKPKTNATTTRTAGGVFGNTTADATATAVPSAAGGGGGGGEGGGGGRGAMRPPQLPSQQSVNTRARPALRSGPLKRGRELQEADEEDEARTSRPSVKRVRHTVMGGNGKTGPIPDVAAALTAAAKGPSSSAATTNTAEQEKSVTGRLEGKSLGSKANEKAIKSPMQSTTRKAPARLGSPIKPNAGPKQPHVRTEWDTDSDDDYEEMFKQYG